MHRYLTDRKLPTWRTILLLGLILGLIFLIFALNQIKVTNSDNFYEQYWFIVLFVFLSGASLLIPLLVIWWITVILVELFQKKRPVYKDSDAIILIRDEIKDTSLSKLTDEQIEWFIHYAAHDSSMTKNIGQLPSLDNKKLLANLGSVGISITEKELDKLLAAELIYLKSIGAAW